MNLPPPPAPDDSRAFRDWCYRVYAAISGDIDMASTLRELIPATQLTSSLATYYTASKVAARVDNFTVTNTDSGAHTMSVHVVAAGGSASAANRIISTKSIAAGDAYNCPEMIGKVIPNGSFIQAVADTGAVLTISASGIEVT